MAPVLFDAFCKAGGCTKGYQRAGFYVVGCDIEAQPNYCGDEFVQADALELLADRAFTARFDAVHASPPCQGYSVTASLHDSRHPRLIEPVRDLLQAAGLPYVIENVVGAPLQNAVTLCGSSFGLGVRRHRQFEVHPLLAAFVPPCAHHLQPEPIDVTGTGGPATREKGGNGGIHRKPRNLAHAREVMGIDWMTRKELSQAIPPAYTEWLGSQLLSHLRAVA